MLADLAMARGAKDPELADAWANLVIAQTKRNEAMPQPVSREEIEAIRTSAGCLAYETSINRQKLARQLARIAERFEATS